VATDRRVVVDSTARYGGRAFVFSATALAGTAGFLFRRIPAAGKIVRLELVFPPGPGGVLSLRPAVITEEGIERNLLTMIGAAAVAGDNLQLVFRPSEPVTGEEDLRVYYANTGLLNHAWLVHAEMEFYGPTPSGVWTGREMLPNG
jgi:hypothetical protein